MKKQVMKALTGLVVLSLAVAQPVVALADEPTNVEEQGGKATTTYVAWIGEQGYESLEEAVANSKSGDTITLGEGTYTLYNKKVNSTNINDYVLNKNLTFEGAGQDKTIWQIGPEIPDTSKYWTEYNSDYTFQCDGTEMEETYTFKNMTLKTAVFGENITNVQYLGFSHTDHTVVDNCKIIGCSYYWGYKSATFRDTIFEAPVDEYAIYTYASETITFDNCTFDSNHKSVKVYSDGRSYPITVNFKDCIVNDADPEKPAICIDDTKETFIINITGENNVSSVARDDLTCSKLFGFGGKRKAALNTGKTTVNINNKKVWENGQMVSHEMDCNGYTYTDGYADKETAYKETFTGSYETSNDVTNGKRNGSKQSECTYCGWKGETSKVTEYKLIYNSNGGTEKNSGSEANAIVLASEDDNSVEKSYWESENASVSLKNDLYEKSGCEFLGWGYNARGKNSKGEDEYVGSSLTMDQAYEVYAQWGHTISYDANGGSGSIENTKAKENSKANVKSGSGFSRSGYSFTGWNTQADGNGTAYQAGAEIKLSSNITLYAQWKASSTSNTTPSGDSTPSTPSSSESSTPATEQTQTSTQSVLGATRPAETVALQPAETVVTQSTETVTEETSAVLGATRDENTEDAVLGQSRGAGTGDESHMAAWGGAAAGALALLALYFGRKNRKNRRF